MFCRSGRSAWFQVSQSLGSIKVFSARRVTKLPGNPWSSCPFSPGLGMPTAESRFPKPTGDIVYHGFRDRHSSTLPLEEKLLACSCR
ncbi:uncharacterized protein BDV17DRAFT_255007 [Aspergillus undulatus]|uniref:uncharacterized protein n=1 Tax=Aspergillus undulatus TaxID=1810928 RepID=UPI003CCE40CA